MKKLLTLPILFFFFSVHAQKWSLKQCIDYALENNLDILQNLYNKDIEEKNLSIAKKERLPSVTGSISNNANFGQNISSIGLINRTDNFNNFIRIGTNVTLYNHKRIQKQIQKSNHDFYASLQNLESTKNIIAIRITELYLNILLNKERVKILESSVLNAQDALRKTIITTEVGTSPLTAKYQAEAELSKQEQELQNARIQVESAIFNLLQSLQLTDKYNYTNFDIENYAIETSALSPYLEDFNGDINKLPQVKSAEYKLHSSEAKIEIEKTNYYPRISLNAGVGINYYQPLIKTYTPGVNEKGQIIQREVKYPTLFQQYKNNFSQQISIAIEVPIFNKGITTLNIEKARLDKKLSEVLLKQKKQDVSAEIQKVLFNIKTNYQKYIAAVKLEKSSKIALDFAQKSYAAGRTSIYDLSTANKNFADAKGSLVQTKYNYLFYIKILSIYGKYQ
ncbi:TolC family protein [Elizabethkingia argentiflava]|uniref:TolC family protein n=1 Tax=Elizabethkingia argenteiflava TaxID=2681556 RepID=A0A845PT22_9FLAO|nr:TolC family protein [Elizabethkingia argenteiflava]NAW51382.1 TolC family protein [Elizabethkingia argenteiflava]